ncbi:hypothetical protein AAKU52_002923 [Pedobacter sp. CG_S7]|uniref:DUF6876 family protein n=1 Tax=Pedobacter sp. CG_S7 TaxID=3143930 RepID=UPI00339ABA5C
MLKNDRIKDAEPCFIIKSTIETYNYLSPDGFTISLDNFATVEQGNITNTYVLLYCLCVALLTDGTKYLGEKYECIWFLDLVAILGKNIKEKFQIWILRKTEGKFNVKVEDVERML